MNDGEEGSCRHFSSVPARQQAGALRWKPGRPRTGVDPVPLAPGGEGTRRAGFLTEAPGERTGMIVRSMPWELGGCWSSIYGPFSLRGLFPFAGWVFLVQPHAGAGETVKRSPCLGPGTIGDSNIYPFRVMG